MAENVTPLGLDSPESMRPYTPADGLDYLGRARPDLGAKASLGVGTCFDPKYWGHLVHPEILAEGDTVAVQCAEARKGGGTRFNGAKPAYAGTVRLASAEHVVIDTTQDSTIVLTVPEGQGWVNVRTEDETYRATAVVLAEYETDD